MEIIRKYFPGINSKTDSHFSELEALYTHWNDKINVISRKDIHMLYEHHVLHSLAIARLFEPVAGSRFLDFGTGGGFPGIPLAIMFPHSEFLLVDSIAKKIKVVDQVVSTLELANVKTRVCRVEDIKSSFDFITARAVKDLPTMYAWIASNISSKNNNSIANGLLYLKGGDIASESKLIDANTEIHSLDQWFSEAFFQTKKLVHIFPKR